MREHGSDFVFVVGYPMAKRPFYTHPDPRAAGVLEQLRPASSAASSSSPAASGCTATRTTSTVLDGGGPGARSVRVVPRSVQARHAAARRVRDRLGTLDGASRRSAEHPRDDDLPARHQPHPTVITIDFAGQVVLVTGGSRGVGPRHRGALRRRRAHVSSSAVATSPTSLAGRHRVRRLPTCARPIRSARSSTASSNATAGSTCS